MSKQIGGVGCIEFVEKISLLDNLVPLKCFIASLDMVYNICITDVNFCLRGG